MPFIKTKSIKGHPYRYLTEGYREQGKVKHKTLKYLGAAPKLPAEAPVAVVLFAGGGGVECGLVEAGIRPLISVEFDPTNPELSKALADNNHLNFKPYGGKVIRESIQNLAKQGFPDFPREPDYLHASPVCSNYSSAKTDGKEQPQDIDAAIAVAQAIRTLQPKCFTLENVPAYENSEAWYFIESALKGEGYQITAAVLDVADCGIPQSRKRFIVKASKLERPGLPPKQKQIGWYEAIADLIPDLPRSELLPAQQQSLNEKLSFKPGLTALLLERVGYQKGKPQVREPAEPIWTIKKSIFHDQNMNGRNRFIDVWLASGEVKALTIEAIARLQSFPRWYSLPDKVAHSGSLLGYSVPPPLIKALIQA